MQARGSDTSVAAHTAQVRVWARIGPVGRLALAAAMSDDVAEVARLGIANRHAGYSLAEVRLAALRSRLGDDMFRRAFPDAPLLEP
jgi:hypothetical protein